MAADKEYSSSTCIKSSLLGIAMGISIIILLEILLKVVTHCKKKHRPNMKLGIEHESHTPDTPVQPLAKCNRRPALTTVETMPGHALSDMDRDIKLQIANSPDLRDLEAALPRYICDPNLITHGH
jgi:hypothetical protein